MTTTTTLDIEPIASTYFDAWAAHDLDRIMAMHAADTRFEIHANRGPAVGRDAVRLAFAESFEAWPGFRFDAKRLLFGARHWTLDWTLISDTGPRGEVRFDCVDVVELDGDGRVRTKDTFVDAAQLQAALA